MTKSKLTGYLLGQRAGRLTVTGEYVKTDKGEKKYLCLCDCGNKKYILERTLRYGGVWWHCRCDCGNEIDVSYNTLIYSNIQSCGCRKKEHDEKLGTFLT